MSARAKAGLLAMGAALAAFAPFAPFLRQQFVNDWGYFNSLGLVVRSSVLTYGRLPTHNPWVCGGLDILANPQNRVFSPMFFADLLLVPQRANVFGFFVYATWGFIGARLLLTQLGVGRLSAIVGAFLFIHGSWFGFHYTEGHIPFGAMQLLPWMAYLALRIGSRPHLIGLGATAALMLLDGAMYPFIYSLLTILSFLVLGLITRSQLRSALSRPLELAAVLVASGLLAVPKVLPVLWAIRDRGPQLDFQNMSYKLVVQALFQPLHALTDRPLGAVWNFHEYGCYLSPLGILLVLTGGGRPLHYWRRAWPFLLGALFWLWVGSGWLQDRNPWHLFHKIPLINNAHVQSRVFILAYMFLVIMIALALDRVLVRREMAYGAVAALLVAEAMFVHAYPMKDAATAALAPTRLIDSWNIRDTVPLSWANPEHYYGGIGSAICYEPSSQPKLIFASGHPQYCGEACLKDRQAGSVRLTRYSPGRIELEYKLSRPTKIELNTNALYGWRILDHSAAELSGRGFDRLVIKPNSLSGKVSLQYRPRYLPWVFSAFAAGIALFAVLWLRARKAAGDVAASTETVYKPKHQVQH